MDLKSREQQNNYVSSSMSQTDSYSILQLMGFIAKKIPYFQTFNCLFEKGNISETNKQVLIYYLNVIKYI